MSCNIEGCTEQKVIARGMCWKHYRRELRHGDANAIVRKEAGTCSEEGCGRRLYGTGLCQMHFQKKKYEERAAAGQCVMCGQANDRETVYCTACSLKRSMYKKNSRIKRKAGARG